MTVARRSPAWWSMLGWSLISVSAVLFLWRCHRFGGFFAEDAYISFRFATHFAEGHGLVWNVGGDPVEGYTSPLHILLLAFAILLGAPVTKSAVAIGLLSVTGLIALYVALMRRETGRLAPLAAVALGAYLVDPRLAIHATAGLDTVMYMALLPLNFLIGSRLLDRPGRARAVALAAANFLCLLGRPDAAPYIAAQGAVLGVVALRRRLRDRSSDLLIATSVSYLVLVVAGLAYLGLKYLYFGYVLPNPFYIKSNDLGSFHGLASVSRYLQGMWRLLPFAPLLLLLDYRALANAWREPGRAARIALMLLPPGVFLAYYTTVVPEVNYLNRFEYPTYFFLILAIGMLATMGRPAERLRDLLATRIGMLPAAGLVALSLIGMLGYFYKSTWIRFPWFEIVETRYYRPIGEALASTGLGPKATVVIDSAGVVPFTSRFSHIDPVGLTDNVLSGREPIDVWGREAYIFGREPDVYIGPEPPASPGATDCASDPVIETEYVRRILLAEDRFDVMMGYLKAYGGLSRDELCDVVHHRMREFRDRWQFLGEIAYPVDAPRGYTTFAYVRQQSPYREELAQALAPVITRKAYEIDRGFPIDADD